MRYWRLQKCEHEWRVVSLYNVHTRAILYCPKCDCSRKIAYAKGEAILNAQKVRQQEGYEGGTQL